MSSKKKVKINGKNTYVTYPQECPLETLCEPDATMAPVIYVSTKRNPRLYPVISRGSKRYKELAKERSGTERSNSFKKWAYSFEKTQLKSRARRLIWLYFLSVIEHRKAMFKENIGILTAKEVLKLVFKKLGLH